MRKSCVQFVDNLRKTCAGMWTVMNNNSVRVLGLCENQQLIPALYQQQYTGFPQAADKFLPLLVGRLSPLPTGPINTITTYIKE